MREVDIGLITYTLPLITREGMIDCFVVLLLYVLLTKVFMVI